MEYKSLDNPDGTKAIFVLAGNIKIKVNGQAPEDISPEHEEVKQAIETIAQLKAEDIQS